MVKTNIYNFEGQTVGTIDLPSAIFEVKTKANLIHDVVVGLEANDRQVLAHTKTRGDVRGGGRKPWKQKGTGRARVGSIRSPLWRGGGITFGPRNERNFKLKINKKVKQAAFKMALSEKVADKSFILLENFGLENLKTKNFSAILKKLPVIGKKVLIIFSDENKNLRLASRNIPNVSQANLVEVNVMDLLKANTVLTTKEAVDRWSKIYIK